MGIRTTLLASTRVAGEDARDEGEQLERAHGERNEEREEDDDENAHGTEELEDIANSISDTDSSNDGTDSTSSYISSQRPGSISNTTSHHASAIHEVQLSPDGTCIFTTDHNRHFSVYPINEDILSTQSPRRLTSYSQFNSSDPLWAFAVNPYFELADAQTTQVLVSARDQYISLYNALWDVSRSSSSTSNKSNPGPVDISTKLASYKLIDHLTDGVIAPISLTYTSDGTHFLAGSKNQIALFDLNYTDDPVTKIRTIPSSRCKLKDGGYGYKGLVSSMAISPYSSSIFSGVLAAGTRTRYIGLYDAEGSGKQITHFPLPGTLKRNKIQDEKMKGLLGNGVTQLKWSPCGKYLYIAERSSDALFIYDVRNYAFSLGHCVGRNALTPQKLGFDIWSPGEGEGAGHEVWAGGIDGEVRVWKDPYLKEGAVEADEVLEVSKHPVSGTIVHPCGNLAVIASGSREADDEGDGTDRGHGGCGRLRPRMRQWGCLDILGLGGYEEKQA